MIAIITIALISLLGLKAYSGTSKKLRPIPVRVRRK